MRRKRKSETLYQAVSVLLGILILWRGWLSIDFMEGAHILAGYLSEVTIGEYMKLLSFTEEGKQISGEGYLSEQVIRSNPLFSYLMDRQKEASSVENKDIYDWIRWKEGVDEDERQIAQENGQAGDTQQDEGQNKEKSNRQDEPYQKDNSHEIRVEKLGDFDYLLKTFYSVDRTTTINGEQLNAERLLKKDMTVNKDTIRPQILIYHTHSQEAFLDSVPGKSEMTVVGVGEKLAEELRQYGYQVLHETTQFDVQNRDYAYSNAEPVIGALLEQNPTIEVVIDLHRDGVAEETHLITDVDGKRTAQYMFFNGLSRTTAQGEIAYLKNEYIEDNLAFSLQLQIASEKKYPGLARKIYLKGYRYNMHFRPKSLLVEVGAQNNTVEEVMNAVKPLGSVIDTVLTGHGENNETQD